MMTLMPATTHAIIGTTVIIAPLLVAFLKNKNLKKLFGFTSVIASWWSLFPAAEAYLGYYQVVKVGIKKGPMPWAHLIFMETKEHWGLLVPLIATTALIMLLTKKKNNKRWWILTSILAISIYIMGKYVRLAITPL